MSGSSESCVDVKDGISLFSGSQNADSDDLMRRIDGEQHRIRWSLT
jgi:hypothetical protein